MSYASTLGVKSVFSCIWPNMQALTSTLRVSSGSEL